MPNFKHVSNAGEDFCALQNGSLEKVWISGKVSAVFSVKLARFTEARAMEQVRLSPSKGSSV